MGQLLDEFMECEWHDNPYAVQMYVTLLLMANGSRKRLHGERIPKGSVLTSKSQLSLITGTATRTVNGTLAALRHAGAISVESVGKYLLIRLDTCSKIVSDVCKLSQVSAYVSAQVSAQVGDFSKEKTEEKGKKNEEKESHIKKKKIEETLKEEEKKFTVLESKENVLKETKEVFDSPDIHTPNVQIPQQEELFPDVAVQAQQPKQKIPHYTDSQIESMFTAFWNMYPKKVGKGQAITAFKRVCKDDQTYNDIMKGLKAQNDAKYYRMVQMGDKQFIPYPATWLNGRRWEDEVQDITAQEEMPF